MKKRLPWLLLLVVFAGLGWMLIPFWEGARELPLLQRLCTARVLQTVQAAAAENSVDEAEAALIAQGFSVLDSDPVYPGYLANSRNLQDFCQGKRENAALLQCTEGRGIQQLLFLRQGETAWFCITGPDPVDGNLRTEKLPVYDMTLSDQGIVYYRCYPEGDPHYIDYNAIRLEPVNRQDYDLLRKYILPMGYQMVNLFLTDWQEGEWDRVSLTDTLEFFYTMQTGEEMPWQQWQGSTSRIFVPGDIFEETILPWFALTKEQLWQLCDFDPETGCYPWRPVHGDQLVTWSYPMCEPELISCRNNPDGTWTLEIQVRSPEKRGELLFSHQVTIRELETGFQYVGNRITYVSGYGLPVTLPRFQLDSST